MIALLAVSASFALDGEIAVELGTTDLGSYRSNAWLYAPDSTAIATGGGRLALATGEHTAFVTGYHYGAGGAQIFPGEDAGFIAAVRVHQVTLGEQIELFASETVAPYVLPELSAYHATALFDSDPGHDDNPTQFKRSGVTAGGALLVGVDVHARQGGASLAPAGLFEIGYAWAPPASLDELGPLPVHGLILRLGGGVRF